MEVELFTTPLSWSEQKYAWVFNIDLELRRMISEVNYDLVDGTAGEGYTSNKRAS
jgi:hypothetical protein